LGGGEEEMELGLPNSFYLGGFLKKFGSWHFFKTKLWKINPKDKYYKINHRKESTPSVV